MRRHSQSPGSEEMGVTPYFFIAAGLLIIVLGFGLDVLWHDLSGIAGHDEAILSASNPGHLLIAVGGAVALAATAAGLWRTSRLLAIATTVVIAAAAVSFAAFGSMDLQNGARDHENPHDESASHSHHVEAMEGANDED